MKPDGKRALTILLVFAVLCPPLWVAVELWVTGSAQILVLRKNAFSSQGVTRRYIVAEGEQPYGVGISTIWNEDPDLLWAKLEPGCRYDVRYLDQSRYPYARAKDMSGLFIANATKRDCPGLPEEPARTAPSAQELLDRIIGGPKAPAP